MNFGERMLLFCGPVNPPGTSSCDKAQVLLLPGLNGVILHPPRTPRRGRAHAQCWPCAASLEALWDLTVLCYGLRILNTASSGKGQVLATRMGASGTCKMWNYDYSRETQSIFCPLTVPLQCLNLNCTIKAMYYIFCQRQFWISHSLVNSNQINKLTSTKNSMSITLRRTR